MQHFFAEQYLIGMGEKGMWAMNSCFSLLFFTEIPNPRVSLLHFQYFFAYFY